MIDTMIRVGRGLLALAAFVAVAGASVYQPATAHGAGVSVGYERDGRGWMVAPGSPEGVIWTWTSGH